MALLALQATVAGRALEKRLGRARCCEQFDDVRGGCDIAAGCAAERFAERAGEDVDLAVDSRNARACRGRSCPSTPMPCESSTTSMASYSRQRATSSGSLATSPSMLKTPSVTTQRQALPACGLQLRFEVGQVAVLIDLARIALLTRRMPSMMLAWLSSSERMTSSGPASVGKRASLAFQQLT